MTNKIKSFVGEGLVELGEIPLLRDPLPIGGTLKLV